MHAAGISRGVTRRSQASGQIGGAERAADRLTLGRVEERIGAPLDIPEMVVGVD
jgi:hypothetical protein